MKRLLHAAAMAMAMLAPRWPTAADGGLNRITNTVLPSPEPTTCRGGGGMSPAEFGQTAKCRHLRRQGRIQRARARR